MPQCATSTDPLAPRTPSQKAPIRSLLTEAGREAFPNPMVYYAPFTQEDCTDHKKPLKVG